MQWFRRHIKTGSRLALFALLIQLALTSGHMHLDAVHAAPAIPGGVSVEMPDTPGSAHEHRHSSTDPCAICAVMAMAGTMLFAKPPVLLLPRIAGLLRQATEAEFVHLHAVELPFEARAPPIS